SSGIGHEPNAQQLAKRNDNTQRSDFHMPKMPGAGKSDNGQIGPSNRASLNHGQEREAPTSRAPAAAVDLSINVRRRSVAPLRTVSSPFKYRASSRPSFQK